MFKWKSFKRTDSRWSLFHLADKDNKTKCGWTYHSSEFTDTQTKEEKPRFLTCDHCDRGISDNSGIRSTKGIHEN